MDARLERLDSLHCKTCAVGEAVCNLPDLTVPQEISKSMPANDTYSSLMQWLKHVIIHRSFVHNKAFMSFYGRRQDSIPISHRQSNNLFSSTRTRILEYVLYVVMAANWEVESEVSLAGNEVCRIGCA